MKYTSALELYGPSRMIAQTFEQKLAQNTAIKRDFKIKKMVCLVHLELKFYNLAAKSRCQSIFTWQKLYEVDTRSVRPSLSLSPARPPLLPPLSLPLFFSEPPWNCLIIAYDVAAHVVKMYCIHVYKNKNKWAIKINLEFGICYRSHFDIYNVKCTCVWSYWVSIKKQPTTFIKYVKKCSDVMEDLFMNK